MTDMQTPEPQVESQMPLPPVLIRSQVPGRPLTWVDPTPRQADSRGHSWTQSLDEPLTGPSYCLLCLEDYGNRSTYLPCEDAGLLGAVNEERNKWIVANRVNPEDIR